jgi:hypothetical protein
MLVICLSTKSATPLKARASGCGPFLAFFERPRESAGRTWPTHRWPAAASGTDLMKQSRPEFTTGRTICIHYVQICTFCFYSFLVMVSHSVHMYIISMSDKYLSTVWDGICYIQGINLSKNLAAWSSGIVSACGVKGREIEPRSVVAF